ncbi:MAG TPA: 1-acyl-sn-glycerol-3-phosphate acyltransferase [Bacilli bacterium]|nr:1-acyl-sn-glycerol-3-phosphate acyltransferase [Bacilli bacterium]HPS19302.1 1-acyl-sn-glycerol-3-phosphate acyltransferase [Bacilli bacterium]
MKKTRLTLQEKLARRHFKITNRFFYWIYNFASRKIIAKKYHPTYVIKDDINDCKGPAFLIWNHQSRRDHAFISEITSPRRINILAGYNEFFRSHLHIPFKLANIIPKKHFTNDIVAMRGMNEIIHQGGVVCFSPEGTSSVNGMNQPISPGTGRFLQFYHIPVYIISLKGAYLTNTKNDEADRIGQVEVELSLLFSSDDLKKLSVKEIEDTINERFTFDDYAYNKKKHVRYANDGNICRGLADLCYRCPKCGEEFQMVSEKNTIKCSHCGNGATMDDYYDFHPFDETCVIPESPSQWDVLQRSIIIKQIREDPSYCFKEKVKVGYLPPYHLVKNKKTSEICGEGELSIDHDGIHFVGVKLGKPWYFDLSYKAYFSLVNATDLTNFLLFINEEYFEFYPERPSVEKIRLLIEEMHRYHVGYWKNLPCQEHLYPKNNQ